MPTIRRLVDHSGPDFYPTPSWGTRALLANEKFQGSIVEPCAGELHIVKELEWAGYRAYHSDLIDYGMGSKICGFSQLTGSFDNAVTNPPFMLAEPLLMHLFKITNKKICLFLKLSFLESSGRYERLWSQGLNPTRIHVFTERISLYPGGVKGDLAGGTMAHGWFVWEKLQHATGIFHSDWVNPRETVLNFIKPGFKDD